MKKEVFLGILRHILTFGGGIIVTKGLADANMIGEAVGAVVAGVGAILSVVEKFKK